MCLLVLLFTEIFIRNVLQNVGRHNVDVESLNAEDLDQLASLIADALQVVKKQAEKGYRARDLQTVGLQIEEQKTGVLTPDDQQLGIDSWDESVRQLRKEMSPINQVFETILSLSGKYMGCY